MLTYDEFKNLFWKNFEEQFKNVGISSLAVYDDTSSIFEDNIIDSIALLHFAMELEQDGYTFNFGNLEENMTISLVNLFKVLEKE
ncbi:hypothetical protein DND132_0188 [Pseudodesulfovibrio mercurii]|uniref:Uncharacterized protein n=1 Tax=Pseudodesulfovibrio mercurii TaxID=641491 RepID=F0JDW6_9BACT|nr:hypothetical protein [Pseudodesulfovibrio mercurii]EGB13406.1 hypothetical protein DND132_0188 [Pseudodesulfovibrio mercurii]